MREILAREAQEIELGKRGENLACRVVFDISTWQKEYGEGVVQLIHQRNGDKTPYPCVVEADGSNAYWNITSADVDVAGRGHCELQYWVDDAIVKSATYITRTARSMSPASDTPPEPQQAWVDGVLQAGIDAVESAASAEAAAASAEASAESLAESERNAAISEQAAQDAASNAAASQTAAADSEAKAKLYANQCEASVSGVASFNGRGGHVIPQAGDYTAEMVVGAVKKSGDTMTGKLCVSEDASGIASIGGNANEATFNSQRGSSGYRRILSLRNPDFTSDDSGSLHLINKATSADHIILHTGNKNLITASDVGAANRNLLDNWYFVNPVDNRDGLLVPPGIDCFVVGNTSASYRTTAYTKVTGGYTDGNGHKYVSFVLNGVTYNCGEGYAVRGYTGSGYTIDRWSVYGYTSGAIALARDGINIDGSFDFGTVAEMSRMPDDSPITASFLFTDGFYSFTVANKNIVGNAQIDSGGAKCVWYPNWPTADAGTGLFFVNGHGFSSINRTFVAAKLELGTEQTLAHLENGKWVLNEIPDYNEELLKCCMSKADSSDTYANNKETPAAINAVNKAGDTMTGVLRFSNIGTLFIDGNVDAMNVQAESDDKIAQLEIYPRTSSVNFAFGNKDYSDWKNFVILHTGNVPSAGNFIAGSYVGTGTVGKDGKNELTFPFEPKYVVVFHATGWHSVAFTFLHPLTTINACLPSSSPDFSPTAEWSGKTLRWYLSKLDSLLGNGNIEPTAATQANESGRTYYYAAWG